MTTICQNVATFTRATLRTTSTIFVTTSTEQIAGRPITSTVVVPSSTCSTAGSGNSTTVRCATSSSTRLTVITPTPSQVQVIITVTNQIVQTQLNTLFGTLCQTVGGPPPAVTDTTLVTEYYTVTGSGPSTTPTPTPTPRPTTSIFTVNPSRTSLSRNTIYGGPGDPTSDSAPSDTALGADSQSGSSHVPVGAIVGGVVGGVIAAALLGFLIFFLFFKKPIAAKGYKAPGEESHYYDNDQSDVFGSEQTGYYGQGYDGHGYDSGQQQFAQHLQSGPQSQGSYPTQYADMGSQGAPQFQPQDVSGGNAYPEPQGPGQYFSQTEMGQVPFNAVSGAAIPIAAAAGAGALPIVAAASYRYSSSTSSPPPRSHYSPESHMSTPLMHHGSPHQHTAVPYRGYAEPADG